MKYEDIIKILRANNIKHLESIYYDNNTFTIIGELNNSCLILDYKICEQSNTQINYYDYVQVQNHYMFKFNQFYRFYLENNDDLEQAIIEFVLLCDENKYNEFISSSITISDRGLTHPDNTPLELFLKHAL